MTIFFCNPLLIVIYYWSCIGESCHRRGIRMNFWCHNHCKMVVLEGSLWCFMAFQGIWWSMDDVKRDRFTNWDNVRCWFALKCGVEAVILVFLFTLPLSFPHPLFHALLTGTKVFFDGTNCTISMLIIIALLCCSGWTYFGGKQRCIEKDEFWKIPCFTCLHHDQFCGISLSVFFRTFISRCRLFFRSELSVSGPFWLDIDEIRVHLHFEHFSWCNNWIIYSAAPKWTQNLQQSFSFHYPISSIGKEMIGRLKSIDKTWRKDTFYVSHLEFSWRFGTNNFAGTTTTINFVLPAVIVSSLTTYLNNLRCCHISHINRLWFTVNSLLSRRIIV